MASNQPITVVELDLLSYLRQNIARKLAIEASAQGPPWTLGVAKSILNILTLGSKMFVPVRECILNSFFSDDSQGHLDPVISISCFRGLSPS